MKSAHPAKICSWVLFFVGASVRCGQAAQGPAVSSPTALDPVARAVVQLLAIGPGARDKNQECSATGFLVNEEGIILSNAHVYQQAMKCLVSSPRAKIVAKLARPKSWAVTAISCNLVAVDNTHDLALLKPERPLVPSVGSAEKFFVSLQTSDLAAGTPVAVTGHPALAWDPVTQLGKIVRRGTLRLSEESAEASEVIVLDLELQPGTSGSPVYLEGGVVVGVVERRNPSRPTETVAVPIRYAIELLERHGLRWHRGER